MSDVMVLVLAAGFGRRFAQAAGEPQDKLLAPCRGLDGGLRPVLAQVLHNLGPLAAHCLVVTREDAPGRLALVNVLDHRTLIIQSEGMGDSLAAAVQATSNANGWLVVLGDMPFVQPGTYRQVADSLAAGMISVPSGAQGRGHPVLFDQAFLNGLKTLSGDQGGKRLMTLANVHEVPVGDEGIYRDIDLPVDLPL
jgi:molybdenum cofactor cytidylyltransferase